METTWDTFIAQGGWLLVFVAVLVGGGMIVANCLNGEGRDRDKR